MKNQSIRLSDTFQTKPGMFLRLWADRDAPREAPDPREQVV
jgi:hypothetical protein